MTSRRTYQREYARRRRKARWARHAEAVTHCPAMLGNRKPCRWPLENRLIGGVTVPFCAQCDRKARGVCIDCQRAPVAGTVGKALRCAGCKKLEGAAALDRYRKRHPGKIRQQWKRRKRRLLADPAARQAVLDRKRLWRLASPAAVKRHKLADNRSPRARAYQQAYRERMRQARAAQELDRYHQRRRGETITHPCVKCGAAITGRPKKCDACRQADYRAARAALTGAAA